MFKPVTALVNPDAIAQQPAHNADADVTVKRLFMLFHGWYGNLFISKFATNERDENGRDKGIKSARIVWASELREFDPEIVMLAAQRAKTEHQEFPPSLPQFVAICRAVRPRAAFKAPEGPARIGMSAEARSEHSRRVRDAAMAKLRARMDGETGHVRVDEGLNGLKQLIAKAVALGGGDEVAELRRLDAMTAKAGA